ncbi:hypothetical protein [Aquisalimonas sp.]|uniref:hypothetical protein n=1 Tax=Aquisalimonas sp. TaxID=1872621 RepID=UPI0025C5BA52|nr:hypothetical protein [Aquisalimonas sp.]
MRTQRISVFVVLMAFFMTGCHSDSENETEGGSSTLLVDGIQITVVEIEDANDGFLHKRVGVSVTANGGQPAPDGTLVRLRVIDSITAYGNDGSISAGSNQLVSEDPLAGTFNDPIVRQFEPLYADGAQVLFLGGVFSDRGRVVSAVTGPNSLDVDASYEQDQDGLRYWVGKSHYGVTVLGHDFSALPDGVASTEGGKASVIVRYPRFDCVTGDGDCLDIGGYGCGSYDARGLFQADHEPFTDEDNPHSEQVVLFAEISSNLSPESPRHVAVTPDFCFREPSETPE